MSKHPNFLTSIFPLATVFLTNLILYHDPSLKWWIVITKPNEHLVLSPSYCRHDYSLITTPNHCAFASCLSSGFNSALQFLLLSPLQLGDTLCVTMNPLSVASSTLLSHSLPVTCAQHGLIWPSGHSTPIWTDGEHNTNMQIGATSKIWCQFSTAWLGNSLN